MFKVTPLPGKHRVEISFEGNFDHDPADFRAALIAAVGKVQAHDQSFDLICDFTHAHVMPQDHATTGQAAIAWCIENGLRKSANVTASVTQRMQLRRVSEGDLRFEQFADHGEAEEWLAA
jgi:hypothetical protein